MSNGLDPLIRDFVEWVAKEPRAYAQVLEAWRTSCPRLTVWEDASDRGLVERTSIEGQGVFLVATEAGHEFLRSTDQRFAPGAKGSIGSPASASPARMASAISVDGQRRAGN